MVVGRKGLVTGRLMRIFQTTEETVRTRTAVDDLVYIHLRCIVIYTVYFTLATFQ